MAELDRFLISVVGEDNNVIIQKKIKNLPLKEEAVIFHSIRFFDDPEPCMIHRSAVMKRLYMELYEYFKGIHEKNNIQLAWNDIPEHYRQMLDFGREVKSIKVSAL